MTKVVNLYKDKYTVYIGRPSKSKPSIFGNPFEIGKDGTREEVLRKFNRYFFRRIECDPEFKKRVLELYGETLGCFCKPQNCHGDIIATYVDNVIENNYDENEKILRKIFNEEPENCN